MVIQQGLGGENLSAILALQGRPEGRLLTVVVVLDLLQTRVVDVESGKNIIYILNRQSPIFSMLLLKTFRSQITNVATFVVI